MRYLFHDCEIDTDSYEFRAAGQLRRLEPQVFDLLAHLVQHPQRLVSRDELIETVWAGRIVSEATISSRINAARKAVGDSGTRQAVIATVPRRGIRFVAEVEEAGGDGEEVPPPRPAQARPAASRQTIRYCTSRDGTRIAFAVTGSGPPLLRAGHWLTHLEHDWHSPIWRPFLAELGERFTLIRYDQRGNGLSDREVADLSLDAFVADLEAVADAAGLDRHALYASSQAVPVAIEYAARHPGRLTGLALHGGYYQGRLLRSPEAREQGEAYLALMRHGWGAEGSQFLQAFASIFIPDGTQEQVRSVVELQKISATADMAVRLRRAFDEFDVSGRLGEVTVPVLVVHGRNDGVHPLQQSQDMAAMLPDAQLMVLETRNHVLPPQDPVWPEFFEALNSALAPARKDG